MKRIHAFYAVLLMVGLGCYEPDVDKTNNAAQSAIAGDTMPLSPVGPAVGGPFTSIDCPDDFSQATAEDFRRPVAALLANDQLQSGDIVDLQNEKVDRAGDTMTDTLIVNVSTANEYAVRATGNGSGGGIRAVGGSSTGPGGVFLGGATNGNAIEATGTGTGFAAVLGGTASTTTAPTRTLQVQSGGIQLTATSPNSNVDPGADTTIWPQNTNSSSCTIGTDGAGNATVQTAGFNVDTVSIFGINQLVVTFKRTLPGAAYRVS